MRFDISFHGNEVASSGAYLSHDTDHRINYSVVSQGLCISGSGKLVPQFVFPCEFLAGIHQAEVLSRFEGPSEGVVVTQFHLTGFTFFRGDDDDSVGCARTVYGSCCGIFQNRNTLNIIRIYVSYSVYEDVVESACGQLFFTQ